MIESHIILAKWIKKFETQKSRLPTFILLNCNYQFAKGKFSMSKKSKKHKHENKERKESKGIEIPISKIRTKSGEPVEQALKNENPRKEMQAGADERVLDSLQSDDQDMRIQGDKVFVKFAKFINLIVVHDLDDIIDKYKDEEIQISTDLLVDLAGAYEDVDPQLPWGYMLMGIFVGGLVTLILLELVL